MHGTSQRRARPSSKSKGEGPRVVHGFAEVVGRAVGGAAHSAQQSQFLQVQGLQPQPSRLHPQADGVGRAGTVSLFGMFGLLGLPEA
jgi:hypothetical protein